MTDGYTYDAFGATWTKTGTAANDSGSTGQSQDSGAQRGLYYLRARAYDPALGRFLQRDPVPFVQAYAYAGSNPATFVDPSGLCWWCDATRTAGHIVRRASHFVDPTQVCGVYAVVCLPAAIADVIRSGLLKPFETPECAALGLEVGAYLAIEYGGPFGVPLAAALFAASLGIDTKENDVGGVTLSGVGEILLPLEFAKYAPELRLLAKRGGAVATGYSAITCGTSAFK